MILNVYWKKMTKKTLDPELIGTISFDFVTKVMRIFDKKMLLMFEATTTEEVFNKAGQKLLNYLEEKGKENG